MEKKSNEKMETKKPMGRPPATEATKRHPEVTIEDDFVIIKVPRRDLTKRLLAELI